jgi:hypothetical protein
MQGHTQHLDARSHSAPRCKVTLSTLMQGHTQHLDARSHSAPRCKVTLSTLITSTVRGGNSLYESFSLQLWSMAESRTFFTFSPDIPVSSDSSRFAACRLPSPNSTDPPGRDHCPMEGAFALWINSHSRDPSRSRRHPAIATATRGFAGNVWLPVKGTSD